MSNNFAFLKNCTPSALLTTAYKIVRNTLNGDDKGHLLAALDHLLPIIAEIAPEAYLNIVEQTPLDIFAQLFGLEGTALTGRNYMTGLLWSLEVLAWDAKYFSRVCLVLARLASIDPGGNWANRPKNSLTDIFLLWYPHTLAPFNLHQSALL